MILEILRLARRLDKKLEVTVGRPYRILITVGLITEISIQVRELLHAHFTRADFIQTAIWILLALLLVINQLGELSSRMDERLPRRMRNRSGGEADSAQNSSPAAGPGRGRRK